MAKLLVLAPAGNTTFASLPSGSTYVSDPNGIIWITNGSVDDLIALITAGCLALAPLSSLAQFQTLAALYAQDVAAAYPMFTTAIVTDDGTAANDGYWQKTGAGTGVGNWVQLQQGQIASLITQEAANAANIAANSASITTLQARATSDESTIAAQAAQIAAIQATLASAIASITQTKFPANGAADLATAAGLPAYTASGTGATLALTGTANGALTVDGVAVAVGKRVLVKNETSGNAPYNQLYTQTQLGDGSHPYILTIASDANTPAIVNGLSVFVSGGTVNANQTFTEVATIVTIGTTNATWQHTAGGLGVRTSMFQQAANPFTAADIAAAAIGGSAICDTTETYSSGSNYTTTATWRFENGGALTVSGAGNVTFAQPPSYDRFADPYAKIFTYSSTGRVKFSLPGEISPCWWGANYKGSSALADEIATTRALQYGSYAVDGAGAHSMCTFPAGYYLFAVGTTQAAAGSTNLAGSELHIYSRFLRFRAKAAGTVRWSIDPTTIITGASLLGFFVTGVQNADGTGTQYGGAKNPSFIGTTPGGPICSGCFFIGAMDPAKVEFDFVWENLDFVFNPTPYSGLFMGTNRTCVPVYRQGSFRALFANSSFYGSPNDGCYVLGSVTYFRCKGVHNGFYGGAMQSDSTRNGFSAGGWQDLLTPGLTANKISFVECETTANADTGMAAGANAQHLYAVGNTDNGSATTAMEHILGEDILTQWAPTYTVLANQLMYVPGSTSNCPAGLGGLVFQCTSGAGGVTSSSLPGAMSSATVGQTGITDNTVTWKCIGTMPANGRVASTVTRATNVFDGAIPLSVFYPYGIGTVATPTAIQGNGINAGYPWVLNSANENVFKSIGDTVRNYGYVGNSSPCGGNVNAHNGGQIFIDDYECDSCYASASSFLLINCGTRAFGTGANNQARAFVKARFRNPQGAAIAAALVDLVGNWNSYDLEADYDKAPVFYGIRVEHAVSQASVLERGRIKINGNGTVRDPVFLKWATAGSSAASPIIIEGAGYNGNSASITGVGAIHLSAGVSMSLPVTIKLRNYDASYAGRTQYPIIVGASGNITGGLKFDIEDCALNEGTWKLNYGLGGTPALFDSLTPVSSYTVGKCGLPGFKRTKGGTATPTTGTGRKGEEYWRNNFAASGVAVDGCITDGTSTGQTTGCSIAITSGTDNGTYSGGTPPAPGDVITFTGPSNGPFPVTRADNGVIYLEKNVNANGSGTISYSAPAYKQLSLSS